MKRFFISLLVLSLLLVGCKKKGKTEEGPRAPEAEDTRAEVETLEDIVEDIEAIEEPVEIVEAEGTGRETAPDFTLIDLNGNILTLSEQKGKVVFLDFWATWCPPCKQEIPHLIRLYDKYKEEGLLIWGVGLDKEDRLRDFTREYKINYPILVDSDQITSRPYEITGIPATFILDRKGRIAFTHTGFAPGMEKMLEQEVLQLLRGK